MRMQLLPATRTCGLLVLLLFGCNGTSSLLEDGAGGMGGDLNDSNDGPCGVTADPSLEIGQSAGSAFIALEDGDILRLKFASQSGMETSFSLRASSVSLSEVSRVEAQLLVDGLPVGLSSTTGRSCRCADDTIRLDAAIPIDVSLHPDVRSVAQLVTLDAELVVELYNGDLLIVAHSVQVDLEQ